MINETIDKVPSVEDVVDLGQCDVKLDQDVKFDCVEVGSENKACESGDSVALYGDQAEQSNRVPESFQRSRSFGNKRGRCPSRLPRRTQAVNQRGRVAPTARGGFGRIRPGRSAQGELARNLVQCEQQLQGQADALREQKKDNDTEMEVKYDSNIDFEVNFHAKYSERYNLKENFVVLLVCLLIWYVLDWMYSLFFLVASLLYMGIPNGEVTCKCLRMMEVYDDDDMRDITLRETKL